MDKWKFRQARAYTVVSRLRSEGRSLFFWRAVYDSAATGADNDQLWALLSSLSGTSLAHQKALIMTLYRCQPCHFWGSPAGLTWHMTRWPVAIWDSWAGELRGEEVEVGCRGQLTPKMLDLRNTSSRKPISLIYIDQMVKVRPCAEKLGCGVSLNCLSAASLVTQYSSDIAAS